MTLPQNLINFATSGISVDVNETEVFDDVCLHHGCIPGEQLLKDEIQLLENKRKWKQRHDDIVCWIVAEIFAVSGYLGVKIG